MFSGCEAGIFQTQMGKHARTHTHSAAPLGFVLINMSAVNEPLTDILDF